MVATSLRHVFGQLKTDVSSQNSKGNVVEAFVGASFLAGYECVRGMYRFRTVPLNALKAASNIFPRFTALGVSRPSLIHREGYLGIPALLQDVVPQTSHLSGAAQPASFSWVNLIFSSEGSEKLQDLLDKIQREFWYGKLAGIVATANGCYQTAEPLPALQKLETFLQVTQQQRDRHLQRHQELDKYSVFTEDHMLEIFRTWRDDWRSWMNPETQHEYEEELKSPQKGARQRAHQLRRGAFNTFLFQVFGNKHIVLACIQYPICSAVQPATSGHRVAQHVSSYIADVMQAWECEKNSSDYQKRRDISIKLTNQRSVLKKAAHDARQELARASKIAELLAKSSDGDRDFHDLPQKDKNLLDAFHSGELARVRDKCDAAFGWNLQRRNAAGTAAGRLQWHSCT